MSTSDPQLREHVRCCAITCGPDQSSGTVSLETMVAFTEAVASVPGESSSWRQASADTSDTPRSGPHCMLTCAMTPSTTTSVTRPAKRERAELTTPLGAGREPDYGR